ncbi:MAG: 50S ribosome-binding GTPase [Deltaproteobacteria bacterium]|nr:50S ribosome-binding GTPase [Deltaproteobacteria bacterium]
MNIVIVGHVDHGKSTVVGRLLADTNSLPQGKLEQVREFCSRNSRPFEYAFLLDALRDERAQGITIDTARVFFKTAKRPYVILDAPGHVEFVKNMVTGASRADAALLVIDANEGIKENSRRHAHLLSMLGIRQLAVLVNKMDLVGHDEKKFRAIVSDFEKHLAGVGLKAAYFIPVVGYEGENLASRSKNLGWYSGPTVLEALDAFNEPLALDGTAFRMPVQDVYKFTASGDTRRIIAGSVESGSAKIGDELVFYPSGKKSTIASLEGFPRARVAGKLVAGGTDGFTLSEQIYVGRGELAARAGEPAPQVGTRVKASVFWLGKRPLHSDKEYVLKLGTGRARARLESVLKAVDAAELRARNDAETVERFEIAECVFRLSRPLAFDLDGLTPATTRFVLVDDFEISGGGIIRENVTADSNKARSGQAGAKFHQKAALIIVNGEGATGVALKSLESTLTEQGRTVHVLEAPESKIAEHAQVLLEAGLVVLTAAVSTKLLGELKKRLPAHAIHSVTLDARDEHSVVRSILDETSA